MLLSSFSTGGVDYQPGIATLQGLYCNIRIPFRYQLSSSEESTTVLKKRLSVVHASHASSQKKPSHICYESTGLWPETPSSIHSMSLSQTSHNHTGLLIVKLFKIVLVWLGDTQGCREYFGASFSFQGGLRNPTILRMHFGCLQGAHPPFERFCFLSC